MSTLINVTKLVLLTLCAAGYYGTWHLLLNNGATDHMSHIGDVGSRYLPGTTEHLKTVYVGISAIDYQLTVLTLFFWEMVDGSRPTASLFCFHFATQVACGWGLLMIEGLRRGHRWRVISFIGTLGFLVQNATYAVVIPIYLFIYLSTSPLLSSKRLANFLVEFSATVTIPVSLTLGYIVPAILMSLPAPSILSFEQKQTFIAIWQMFPLWVAILQAVLPYLMPLEGRKASLGKSQLSELNALRQIYVMLLIIAGIGQISTITLLASSKWFPKLYVSEYQGVFDPSDVFVPAGTSPSTKMPSIGSGALQLLQYDQLIGSTSMVIFTSIMYIRAYQTSKTRVDIGALVMRGFAAAIVTGPLGYAVACIWARDELIAQEAEEAPESQREGALSQEPQDTSNIDSISKSAYVVPMKVKS